MSFRYRGEKPNQFHSHNVLGIPGYVFGRHWHQRSGPKVNPSGHQDWEYNVRIFRPSEELERELAWDSRRKTGEPVIHAHASHWAMHNSDLAVVEEGLAFPLRVYVQQLVARSNSMPVILEWGCGEGNAVRDLAADEQIKGKALIFGYSDEWFRCWNDIRGVKFLFFVKEHLIEYFKRTELEANVVFSHGAMEYLHEQEFVEYLRAMAEIMRPGAILLFPANQLRRPEFLEVTDIFELPPNAGVENAKGTCALVRRSLPIRPAAAAVALSL
jgi:hypothetical protein